jgi:hypothetical protein
MKKVIIVCLVLGCGGIAFGQDVYTPPRPSAVIPYVPAQTPAPSGDRLHHLLLAAEHLEAAGLHERAAELGKLAEPTLVTLSGRPASCHMGGEVPAPVRQEDGTVAVEYREYGTRIDLVPIVLEGGRMRLELRARVGQIDPTRSVEVEGQTCPGLIVREVDTGVEMRAGQTLILGGLVGQCTAGSEQERSAASEATHADDSDVEPATGEEESELLVLVEPQIVYPLKQGLSPCRTGQPVRDGVRRFPAARAIPHARPGATR